MGEPGFNKPTRVFVATVVGAAIVCTAQILSGLVRIGPRDLQTAAVFLGLGLLWGLLTFKAGRESGGRVAIGLAPACYLALVPLVEPSLVLVVALSVTGLDWVFFRRPAAVGLFNLGQVTLGVWIAVKVGQGILSALPGSIGVMIATTGGAGVASLVGLATTVLVIKLATDRSPKESGATSFAAISNEVILAGFSAMMAVAWTIYPVLIAVPVVPLTLVFVLLGRLEGREHELRDEVAQRKQAETQMRRAKELAEAASKAKGDFLASMSHEIRTPMNGILGMTDLALDTNLTAEQRGHLLIVRNSANSLLSVINDVLDFSKVDAGQLVLDPVSFDLRAWVAETLAMLAHIAEEKGLELRSEVDANIPERVVGDMERMRQVLVNLVGNAIKFTETGGVEVRVVLLAWTENHLRIRVLVQDTGIGIPQDKKDLIFEAFAQAERYMTRKYGGTGLGLAISTRLVQALGGTIQVESLPGEGSTFYFTIPLEICSGPSETIPPARDHAREGNDNREPVEPYRQLRILLAEDNPVNQKLAVRLLARRGHEVRLAHNGLEAVDLYGNEEFDVILMDVQMPEMDGLTATAEIRKIESIRGSQTPIIALTAHAMEEDKQRCLAAGMDDFVTKPISPGILYQVLEQVTSAAKV